MGASAIPVVLTFLLVAVACRVVFMSNRDLARVRAWGSLARRLLPMISILAMAATLPLVLNSGETSAPYLWLFACGVALFLANFLSMPLDERRATGSFRRGDYARAAELYRKLAEGRGLARYWAFLGAALGAGERSEEAIKASQKATELDPKYGLAYYNRALIQRRMGRKSRAKADLKKALGADLPRRFRNAARGMLEEL